MGWQFPYVSTYETDFPRDFALALTEEQAVQIPEVKEMIDDLPEWLEEWSRQSARSSRTASARGRATSPSRENGTIYHTYTVMALTRSSPRSSASCSGAEGAQGRREFRSWRKDEYLD